MGDGRLDDLDVTREELDSIGEALKNEQFRKLLCEYVDEINDPANRAQYEREVAQYERERGAEVTFVRPRPGYAMKTSADGVRKVFVNVCACDVVDKPTVDAGRRWSLPHCLSPVRRDYDNARRPCDVYDVVFHPDALDLAGRDRAVKDMIEDTALTVIEKNNGVVLDRANVKYPKISFKGVARPLVIRRRIDGFQPCEADADETERLPPGCPPYEPPVDRPVQRHDLDASTREKSPFAVPKYVIKYRTDVDIQEHAYNMLCKMNAVIPKQLIVEINLPLLDSSANVQLDVLPKSLTLVCHKPSKYKLDVGLPYSVLDDQGDATFDQSTRKLIVRLPVSRTEPSLEYVRRPVEEVRTTVTDGERENGEHHDVSTGPESSDAARVNDDEVAVTNGRHDENNTLCDTENDVHYTLPEHEFIYGSHCVLTLHVKNVDPTSINLIVVNDKHSVSGKFHNVGSGFFPIWYAFCIQIPSESSLLNSDLKVIPSDNNLVLEFSARFKPDCKQYWYGLDQDHLTLQRIETGIHKENSNPLANGVPDGLNDSDDDNENDGDDDDVFDGGKRGIASNGRRQEDAEKRDDDSRCKDKNGKITAKEKGKKKKSKKIPKSNAIPIAGGLPGSGKKIDFVAGSLPVEFNNIRPTIVSVRVGLNKPDRYVSNFSLIYYICILYVFF